MMIRSLSLSALLAITALSRLWLGHQAVVPDRERLSQFPHVIGEWAQSGETEIPASIQSVLKADDYMDRLYRRGDGTNVDVFVAYYQVQKAGENMHSPKNCLPGSGWQVISSDQISLPGQSASEGHAINRYVVEKDGQYALVFYWFQVHGRVVASEYWEKIYLVNDAMRTGRRDGALVRVTVPLKSRPELERAAEPALVFARNLLPELPRFIPN